jgi:hypothetical protein
VIVMDGRPVDLTRARREAKALLSAARAGDTAARERVLAARPAADAGALRLADAQLAIARELGARSWPALVRAAQTRAMACDERARTLVEWATSGRRDDAEAVLALDPGLARVALDAALALGARSWPPLLYVAYSASLGGERTDGLVACAQALLRASADPDAASQDDGYDRPSALHGAAGVAHQPRLTALLLTAGADPDTPAARLALHDGLVVGAASFFAHGDTVLGRHLAVAANERRAGRRDRTRARAGVRARGADGGRACRRGRADTGDRRLLPAAGLRAARVAARPLVLSAAAPWVTRRGSVVRVPWVGSCRRAGPVDGSRSSDSAGSV